MGADDWFDDFPVLGKRPPELAAAKLREVSESEAADALSGCGWVREHEALLGFLDSDVSDPGCGWAQLSSQPSGRCRKWHWA